MNSRKRRSLELVNASPKVESAVVEEEIIWIYYRPGYQSGSGELHVDTADSFTEAGQLVRSAYECRCDRCEDRR